MRFIDSNIFLHAFLIPRRSLTREEQHIKNEAKRIVKRIKKGENVATTVVHLSEVINIIEDGLSLQKSLGFLAWTLTSGNFKVFPVTAEDYEVAVSLGKDSEVSANDALACLFMRKNKIKEIYSFDKHFDKLKGIVRLP
ncbi:MAG: type II toxin-antitoxin system VapC family toxin [Candidatus Bathyarchaeia archaeon]